MSVKVITSKDHGFEERANQIVALYNESNDSDHHEQIELAVDHKLKLIFVEGVDGGVIVDAWHDNSNNNFMFYSINFAAFPPEARNKGHLKACMRECGFPIETVQINPWDPIELWQNLGFTLAGTLGFTTMLRSRDFENVRWGPCFI